jgi:hypothetical protein
LTLSRRLSASSHLPPPRSANPRRTAARRTIAATPASSIVLRKPVRRCSRDCRVALDSPRPPGRRQKTTASRRSRDIAGPRRSAASRPTGRRKKTATSPALMVRQKPLQRRPRDCRVALDSPGRQAGGTRRLQVVAPGMLPVRGVATDRSPEQKGQTDRCRKSGAGG